MQACKMVGNREDKGGRICTGSWIRNEKGGSYPEIAKHLILVCYRYL